MPLLTVTNNLKLLQNIKSACTVGNIANLVHHADSYTKMKLKNCKKQIKCKKCNHIKHQFPKYTTLSWINTIMTTPMTTPRVSKISTLTQSLTLVSLQKITMVHTKVSVISWVPILWEFGDTQSHTMNTHGLMSTKTEH